MTTVPTSSHRSRTMAVATLLAVAVGSALAGAAIDRAYMQRALRFVGDTGFHPISSSLRAPTDADRQRIRAELSQTLSLTADQNRLIDSIMNQRAGQFDHLRETIRPQVETLLGALRSDIETVLTPDQRVRYRQLQATPTAGASR
jgi:hypothetical protein